MTSPAPLPPLLELHLSKMAQRVYSRSMVYLVEDATGRRYELHRVGRPPQVIGETYGTARAALLVLQRAAREAKWAVQDAAKRQARNEAAREIVREFLAVEIDLLGLRDDATRDAVLRMLAQWEREKP